MTAREHSQPISEQSPVTPMLTYYYEEFLPAWNTWTDLFVVSGTLLCFQHMGTKNEQQAVLVPPMVNYFLSDFNINGKITLNILFFYYYFPFPLPTTSHLSYTFFEKYFLIFFFLFLYTVVVVLHFPLNTSSTFRISCSFSVIFHPSVLTLRK